MFFAAMRSILDSYYSTIVYLEKLSIKKLPLFADFVYDWFEEFEVDFISRKIVKRKPSTDPDDARVTFYLEVINPYLEKMHEVQTFRSFLLESMFCFNRVESRRN